MSIFRKLGFAILGAGIAAMSATASAAMLNSNLSLLVPGV